jgi:hypothetical protein
MEGSEMSQAAAVEQSAPTANSSATTPDRYDLHGKRISISYIPDVVIGPISTDGPVRFVYQDDVQTLKFTGDDIRTNDVPDLGTVVSVTIGKTFDMGYTSFSVLIPHVTLTPQFGLSAAVSTVGITTVHRELLALGHPQAQNYNPTRLRGTAAKLTTVPLAVQD